MKQRVITGVVAALSFVGVLIWGGYAFALLIALVAVTGFHEFARMNKISGFGSGVYVGYAAVLCMTVPFQKVFPNIHITHDQLVWFVMLVLLILTVFFNNRTNLHRIAILLIGAIYIGYGFHYMLVTRLNPEDGLLWSLFIFGCIWLTDTGAYFSGRLFGKHPLAPLISPKKTIEGAVGGIIFSILFAYGFTLVNPEWIGLVQSLVLAVLISIIGQIGDLVQSAYKRMLGVKDSGTILPGHGGVLDRVDSWLFVFPVIHLLGFM